MTCGKIANVSRSPDNMLQQMNKEINVEKHYLGNSEERQALIQNGKLRR